MVNFSGLISKDVLIDHLYLSSTSQGTVERQEKEHNPR